MKNEATFEKDLKNKNLTVTRVTSYLNFPGNTEAAFNFYKEVFRGEFSGAGLTRFGDIDMPAGSPPMSDADKKLIIHEEVHILGGYILMATDAAESMDFKLAPGTGKYGINWMLNYQVKE